MPCHDQSISRPCTYYGRNGSLCGKPSYNGTCKIHRKRVSLTPCILCARGTASKTGYCTCSYRQMYVSSKMKRLADEMDEYIDEVLSWDWESYSPPRQAPPQAVPVQAVKPLAFTLTRLLQQNTHAIGLQRALGEAIQAALAEDDNFENQQKSMPHYYSEDATKQHGQLSSRLGVSERSSRNNRRGHQI